MNGTNEELLPTPEALERCFKQMSWPRPWWWGGVALPPEIAERRMYVSGIIANGALLHEGDPLLRALLWSAVLELSREIGYYRPSKSVEHP